MLNEDVINLILNITGQKEIDRLTKSTENYKALIESLVTEYNQGTVAVDAYEKQLDELNAAYQRELLLLRELQTTQQIGVAGLAAYRENFTGLSYVMNDFLSVQGSMQQRFNAIANNMPMLLSGFGGLGLALSALIPLGSAIASMLQNMTTGSEESEKALKKLEEQVKAGLKAFEQFSGLKPPAILESGRRTSQVLAEAGGDQLAADLAKQQLERSADPRIADLKRQVEQLRAEAQQQSELGGAEQAVQTSRQADETQKQLDAVLAEVRDKAKVVIGDLFTRATGGDVAAQQELGTRIRRLGRGDVADQLLQAQPGAIENQRRAEEAAKEREKQEAEAAREKERADREAKQQHERDQRIGEWFEQQADSVAVDMQQKAERDATRRQRQADAANHKQQQAIDAQGKALAAQLSKATLIDDQAHAMAAQLGMQGANPQQATGMISREAYGAIRRAMPSANTEVVKRAAIELATAAVRDANIGLASQMLGNQEMMEQQLRAQREMLRRLQAEAANVGRRVQGMGAAQETMLNMGVPGG